MEPVVPHVNLSQRQLSVCFNWTLELFYIQECLFLIQTHFSNIQGQEIHFLREKTTWIIRILWSNTLILETSLHTVYTMFDSPVVTWSHRHVQLYLYLYRLDLLHKCNNSLAYIRWVDLCYLVKHLRPHSNDRLSAESRVSPLRKTPLAHSALEFNKALADLEVWLLDVSASGVFFIVMLCPRLLRC